MVLKTSVYVCYLQRDLSIWNFTWHCRPSQTSKFGFDGDIYIYIYIMWPEVCILKFQMYCIVFGKRTSCPTISREKNRITSCEMYLRTFFVQKLSVLVMQIIYNFQEAVNLVTYKGGLVPWLGSLWSAHHFPYSSLVMNSWIVIQVVQWDFNSFNDSHNSIFTVHIISYDIALCPKIVCYFNLRLYYASTNYSPLFFILCFLRHRRQHKMKYYLLWTI